MDEARMSTVKADVNILTFFFKMGKFFGVVPLHNKKSSRLKTIISLSYFAILSLLLSAIFIVSVWDRHKMYDSMKVTNIIVDVLVMITNFCFILTIRLGNLINNRYFDKIMESFRKIDACLDQSNFTICRMRVFKIYFFIVGFHVLYLGMHAYELYYRIVNHQTSFLIWVLYIPGFLKIHHQLFVVTLVAKMNTMLHTRYQFVIHCLGLNIDKENLNLELLELNKKSLTLDQIYYVFKKLYDLVSDMNVLFNWQIFFVLTCTVLEILNVINFMKQDQAWSVLAVDIAYGALYTISTLAIIKSCNDVQMLGEKVYVCCYTSQETLGGSKFENELLKFAKLIKPLLPQYTAGGFVTVNQRILSSLFSATLTYLIVIIQFDLST
ncbi:unnamed protein product [Phyllotreta striolata]|uniref:Gustatory receptor n=1 Tax=Phyllotreta striolata TaxID=444603 RepID=A0A9N9XM31_PHYSR|nr:unnamed protein product [Phyllotreta striolata]